MITTPAPHGGLVLPRVREPLGGVQEDHVVGHPAAAVTGRAVEDGIVRIGRHVAVCPLGEPVEVLVVPVALVVGAQEETATARHEVPDLCRYQVVLPLICFDTKESDGPSAIASTFAQPYGGNGTSRVVRYVAPSSVELAESFPVGGVEGDGVRSSGTVVDAVWAPK